MMRLNVKTVGKGLHPSELVVTVETRDGAEELVVSPTIVSQETIEVGWPVGRDDGFLLVELPRQTASGVWRVWVDEKYLKSERQRVSA